MIFSLLQVIPSDAVAERHYFLEPLQAEPALWCIRGAGFVAAVVLLVLYRKMKRKDGE